MYVCNKPPHLITFGHQKISPVFFSFFLLSVILVCFLHFRPGAPLGAALNDTDGDGGGGILSVSIRAYNVTFMHFPPVSDHPDF